MIIEIDHIAIEVLRKPVKNLSLRIYPPDGLVKMSVPLRYSDKLIRQHLEDKMAWIHKQRERIRLNVYSNQKEDILKTGAYIAFQGTQYSLIFEEHNGPSNVKLHDTFIHCHIPTNATSAQKQMLLDSWYRKEMQIILPALIARWQTIVGVHVAQWGIKKMKTRWGSCNTRAHRIWLNLNLMKKPVICLEYVLVHELVHLLEASHNKRFHALMTQFMPQWREYQLILEGKPSQCGLLQDQKEPIVLA